MRDIIVDIHHLSKSFSKDLRPALKNINAVIPKGKIFGLAGPDGAGKTTLIRLIAGLLRPSEGQITVASYDTIKAADKIHYLIGYMPQKFGLYEDLTVMQNLTLHADLRGLSKEERKGVFEKLLTFTQLTPFTSRLTKNLSGGMKQKLGLACALICKPTLLLLDEPSVGVDPISRRELWKMVHQLVQEGITVIWSTAYLDEAERCDSVMLLNEGELLFHGPPVDLTERVKDRVFKISNIKGSRRALLVRVLQQKNIIDGIIQGSDVRFVTRVKQEQPLDVNLLDRTEALHVFSVPARFEDAFIDILGGGPGGISLLAENTSQVASNKETVIETQGLTKKFGTFTAADDITFKIKRGEIFGLLGPNGAGKSTIFKMMSGLLKPTHGNAIVNGLDLEIAPGQARAQIGYMAQKFSLYGNLTTVQNLEFFSGVYNLSGNQQREAVERMVKIFELEEYKNVAGDLLPFGFKQRLALACATMHHPEVLFLDEPTSGVDPITRREFWTHINGLVEKGITVMVTTHFMEEAEYCDRIALIYRGKIINMGMPDSLKEIARSEQNVNPTLEDAFIQLIENYDKEHPL